MNKLQSNILTLSLFLFIYCLTIKAEEPIRITTENELKAINNKPSASYELGNDIVLTEEWVPLGSDTPFFTGSFDGKGYTIYNITISDGKWDLVGFFARTKNAHIRNLVIRGANIATGSVRGAGQSVGAIAGEAMNTTIENCHITESNILGNLYVGSIIGRTISTGNDVRCVINNCHSDATVESYRQKAGGIIGVANNTDIINCYFSGRLKVHINADYAYAGGIIAAANGVSSSIRNCLVVSPIINSSNTGRIAAIVEKGKLEMHNNYVRSDLVIKNINQATTRGLEGESIPLDQAEYVDQTTNYTSDDIKTAYNAFNTRYLRGDKNIYRAKWNNNNNNADGIAAIWVQAIYFDMALNEFLRTGERIDSLRMDYIFKGNYAHYAQFNYHQYPNVWFIYDDIMWWVISLARAYEVTSINQYLTLSESGFDRVWNGSEIVGDEGSYDPVNSGMFWAWDQKNPVGTPSASMGKMACINYPTVIAAMTLYNVTKNLDYLDKAKEIYRWAYNNIFDPVEGRIADSRHGSGNPYWKLHVYNQATAIGAAMMLYKETQQRSYLEDAVVIASQVKNIMSVENGIIPFETGREQGIYTAIFAQYITQLIEEGEQYQYLPWLRYNISKGWSNRNTSFNITNKDFDHLAPNVTEIQSYDASGIPALMILIPPADKEEKVVHCKSLFFYKKNLNWNMEDVWMMTDSFPTLRSHISSSIPTYYTNHDIKVFPSSSKELCIRVPHHYDCQVDIQIYNTTGNLLKQQSIAGIETYIQHALLPGIYIIKVGSIIKKINI